MAQRAIEAYRTLVNRHGGAHRAALAYVCAMRARMGGGPEDQAEVLDAARQAMVCYNELRAYDPQYQPLYLAALDLLADQYAASGQPQTAADILRRAIESAAVLTYSNPGQYEPDQVRRLRQLAEHCAEFDPPAAIDSAERAFGLAKRLGNDAAARSEVATSALLLSRVLAARPDSARLRLSLAENATHTYGSLAEQQPDDEHATYRAAHAEALLYRAYLLTVVDPRRATNDISAAIDIYHDIVPRLPHYRPALVEALLAYARHRANEPGDAKYDPYRDAIDECRSLAMKPGTAKYRHALARNLLAFADALPDRGKYKTESLERRQEAAALLAELAPEGPGYADEAIRAHQDLISRLGTHNDVAARSVRQQLRQLLEIIAGQSAPSA